MSRPADARSRAAQRQKAVRDMPRSLAQLTMHCYHAAMLSRRDAIRRAAAAGAAAIAHRLRLEAAASQPATKVSFSVPSGACDCHTHVFGDVRAFPFAPGRTYTPEPASVAEMRSLHRALKMERVVVVQPSVYGTDNTCTVDRKSTRLNSSHLGSSYA